MPSNIIKKRINMNKDLENLELIKTVEVENDEVISQSFTKSNDTFEGDILPPVEMSKEEQYQALMNMFLNRQQKRKLNRYKGKQSFTDRIYGRK